MNLYHHPYHPDDDDGRATPGGCLWVLVLTAAAAMVAYGLVWAIGG